MNVLKTSDHNDRDEDNAKRSPRMGADAETSKRVGEVADKSTDKQAQQAIDSHRTETSEKVKSIKTPEADLQDSAKPMELFGRSQEEMQVKINELTRLLEDKNQKEIPLDALDENYHKKLSDAAQKVALAQADAAALIEKGSPEAIQAKERISIQRNKSVTRAADTAAEGSKTIIAKVAQGVGTGGKFLINDIGKPGTIFLKDAAIGTIKVGGELVKATGAAFKDIVLSLWSLGHEAAQIRNQYNANNPRPE